MGTTSETPTTPAAPAAPEAVPYGRFAEVNQAKNAAEAALQAVNVEKAALAQQLAAVNQEKAALAQRHEAYRASVAVGLVHPEVAELAEYSYNRLPAEGRPAFEPWLREIAADPAKAPVVLRPHLGGQAPAAPSVVTVPAAPAAPVAPATPGQPANLGTGVIAQPPTASPGLTPAAIAAMSDDQFLASLPALQAANPHLHLPAMDPMKKLFGK